MAIIPFKELHKKVELSVANCDPQTSLIFLRQAAREVVERTQIWPWVMPPRRLTPKIGSYEYNEGGPVDTAGDLPPQSEVSQVTRATMNGSDIRLTSYNDIIQSNPRYPDKENLGKPREMAEFDSKNFVINPLPDRDEKYDLRLFVTLIPTRDATGIDETVLGNTELAIIEGAVHYLLLQSGRPWFNDILAAHHGRQYSARTNEIRANKNLSGTRDFLQVEQRAFI